MAGCVNNAPSGLEKKTHGSERASERVKRKVEVQVIGIFGQRKERIRWLRP